MRLYAPKFWQKINLFSVILLPFSLLYYTISLLLKLFSKFRLPYRSKAHIICVGNVNIGGTGKTLVAISLANFLMSNGIKVCFLTRGYGGLIKGPLRVDPILHTSEMVGDEALLLAGITQVVVSANKVAGAKLAEYLGAQVIIMDDGMQNNSIYKDLNILVFNGLYGLGNGVILPAGPLREPLKSALKKSDLALIIGEDCFRIADKLGDCKLTKSEILINLPNEVANSKIIAFAGIGHPEKFFHSLREVGINLIKTFPFPDHYQYTESDINDLLYQAKVNDAKLVTTEKDAMRIDSYLLDSDIFVIEAKIEWEDFTIVEKLLNQIILYEETPLSS